MAYTGVNSSLNHLVRLLSNPGLTSSKESQIPMLKLELGFLRTFLWWTTKRCRENGNLEVLLLKIEVVARNAVSHIQSILPNGVKDMAKDLDQWSPEVLHHIQLLKPEIEKAYIKVAKSSPPLPDTLVVVEFMNSLIDNLKDLLCYRDPSTFSELRPLVTKLKFLRNLLSFVATRCTDQEKLKDLSNLTEAIAIEAACIPFICLFDPKDGNSTSSIKDKLTGLTQQIKPVAPDIRRIYVGVLEALTIETDIPDPDLGSFIYTLQDYLADLQDNQPPWMDSLKVNFEALHRELTFLSSFAKDPPNQFIENDKSDDSKVDPVQVLLEEIRDWSSTSDAHPFKLYTEHLTLKGQFTRIQDMAVKVGCTIFRFNELEEHKLVEAETTLVGLIEKIKHLKSEIGAPMLTLPEVNIIRIDDLGFVRNLRELLDRQAGPVGCLKRRVQGIADELEFLSSFLKNCGERRHEHEKLRNLATQIITVAYRAEYGIESLLTRDSSVFYHSLFIDVVGEMKRIRREVMVFDQNMSYVTEPKVVNPIMPSRDLISVAMLEEQVGFTDEMHRLIEMSYQDLPDCLRHCFLYFGALPQDDEILTSKLIRLWIAEGLIEQTEGKSLEDVAMDYLMLLIGKSLIMVKRKSSLGDRVKSCRVHKLIHEFCLAKAKHENVYQLIDSYRKVSTLDGFDHRGADSSEPKSAMCEHRRLFISSDRNDYISSSDSRPLVHSLSRVSGPLVRSLVLTGRSSDFSMFLWDVSSLSQNFKLLRVLDLGCINVGNDFPAGLEKMSLLKYLEVRGEMTSIPCSIGSLQLLETFVIIGLRGEVAIPDAIWNLTNLRHLHINGISSYLEPDKPHCPTPFAIPIGAPDYKQENSGKLPNLRTMSTPSLRYGKDSEEILRRLQHLEKLKCVLLESREYYLFPRLDLDFLEHLDSLKLFYYGNVAGSCEFNFPSNLRRLTLSRFRLPWKKISIIGRLANLEVLKLQNKAFEGSLWKMKIGEFRRLKFLKLDTLDLEEWSIMLPKKCFELAREYLNDRKALTNSDIFEEWLINDNPFPCLERVELQKCKELKEIPLKLSGCTTLREIEVKWCNEFLVDSARRLENNLAILNLTSPCERGLTTPSRSQLLQRILKENAQEKTTRMKLRQMMDIYRRRK